ncbi:hypothetical protein NIES4071_88020 [Calothrix sp. NIES-4071]|nr:hypothetical protein NIES4071_88020 [Calothrix sp. NIES-4071]BAZ63069.1 hypothetical protein NIES4105_87950 [Calothrix sp. NIES-4105]
MTKPLDGWKGKNTEVNKKVACLVKICHLSKLNQSNTASNDFT